MKSEVYNEICGSKIRYEHRYHLEDGESKVSAYAANQESNYSSWSSWSREGEPFDGEAVE